MLCNKIIMASKGNDEEFGASGGPLFPPTHSKGLFFSGAREGAGAPEKKGGGNARRRVPATPHAAPRRTRFKKHFPPSPSRLPTTKARPPSPKNTHRADPRRGRRALNNTPSKQATMQRADTLDLMFLDAGPISFEASMDATSPRAEQADDGLLALPHAADQDLPGAFRTEGSLSWAARDRSAGGRRRRRAERKGKKSETGGRSKSERFERAARLFAAIRPRPAHALARDRLDLVLSSPSPRQRPHHALLSQTAFSRKTHTHSSSQKTKKTPPQPQHRSPGPPRRRRR